MQLRNKNTPFVNIVFDLDGTLIDSAPSILGCLRIVVESGGYVVNRNFDKALIGPPLRDTLELLTQEKDGEKLNYLIEKFKLEYDLGACNIVTAYSGISTLLVDLKGAGKNIFIVTNKRYVPTRKILANLGWDDLINDAYTIDYPSQHFHSKSQVINRLLTEASLTSSDTCYIGDRVEDYEAAKENNLTFIHVSWGYGIAKDIPLDSILVETPNQLQQLLIS